MKSKITTNSLFEKRNAILVGSQPFPYGDWMIWASAGHLYTTGVLGESTVHRSSILSHDGKL